MHETENEHISQLRAAGTDSDEDPEIGRLSGTEDVSSSSVAPIRARSCVTSVSVDGRVMSFRTDSPGGGTPRCSERMNQRFVVMFIQITEQRNSKRHKTKICILKSMF